MRKKLDEPFSVEGIEAQLQSYVSIAKAPEDVKELDDILDLMEYEPEHMNAQVTVQYREALSSGEAEKLRPVLREGRICKEALD